MGEELVRMDPAALASARVARGWTEAELARQVSLSPPTRQKAVHGQPVSVRTAARIARALRMRVAELLAPRVEAPADLEKPRLLGQAFDGGESAHDSARS